MSSSRRKMGSYSIMVSYAVPNIMLLVFFFIMEGVAV